MDIWKKCFGWMLQTKQHTKSMEVIRTKKACSGTYINNVSQGRYDMVNSVACKTGNGSPHLSAKGGVNKGVIRTSTYASGENHNKTPKI